MIFLDARTFSSPTLDCDLCIVGGGPAGLALALELGDAAGRICILEAGGRRPARRAQALLRGAVDGDYPALQETRMSALGGSTHVWAGWCRPLDDSDFATRSWLPDSGWPFPAATMAPWYERAYELLGLGPVEYDAATWERSGSSPPFERIAADSLRTCMVHLMPGSFADRQAQRLAASRAQVLLHACALRLVPRDAGGCVDHVAVGTLDGRRMQVRARRFVLATGGIENARLLLLSGDSPERSLGNERGLVGRHFMEHGYIGAGHYLPSGVAKPQLYLAQARHRGGHAQQVRACLALDESLADREQLLNCAIFFHPAYESHAAFDSAAVRALLEAWDKLRGRAPPGGEGRRLASALRQPLQVGAAAWQRLAARPREATRWRLRAQFECAPRPENTVTLATSRDALGRPQAQLRWRWHASDLESVRRVHQAVDARLRAAGAGRFELRLQDVEEWREAVEIGKHHMGTTRMHADPSRGVVDADSRVHGCANLYVAGSSVFPTGGFANPTLTIVALAARLAAHLKATPLQEGIS